MRYLADLSPEHQQIWTARELPATYKLHPDYYRATILGEWFEREPVIDAILQEMKLINEMSEAMGKPPLFRETFRDARPEGLELIIRPTLREFHAFVHLLDKVLSENLNRTFFEGEIDTEAEEEAEDGRVKVRTLGTIALLEAWIAKYFRPRDPSPLEQAFEGFRTVRRLRQRPAHSIDENVFDQKYFAEQRDVLEKAFHAVRTLRMVFENHPAAKAIEVPDHLRQGKVWFH